MSACFPPPPSSRRTSQKKIKWTHEQDEQLREAARICGVGIWNAVAARVPGRTGKQCRERWIGQIAPAVSKDAWTPEEDETLIRAHRLAGNRWTAIAEHLPGRPALSIKNRWHWLCRRGQPKLRGSPPDIVERMKPGHRVFEPLVLDDRSFGPAFEEFRARMFMQSE